MLVSQWRECIAIKRQWGKGTLKHRLVSYVMNYDKSFFANYVFNLQSEMCRRNIKFQEKYLKEILYFCRYDVFGFNYPEHNNQYFKQCYYNLEEKHDRGIISDEEWKPINDLYWELDDKGYY